QLCLDATYGTDTLRITARFGGKVVRETRILAEGITATRLTFDAPRTIALGSPRSAGPPPVTVAGIAYDSLHARPLGNAFVIVEGTTRSAISDSSGHFLIDSVTPGPYRIIMQHDALDALGISSAGARVLVSDGRDT